MQYLARVMHYFPSLPTLRNGLAVVFSDLEFFRHPFNRVTLNGWSVTLGHTLTLSAYELAEAQPKVYAECLALAQSQAEDMARQEQAEYLERRAWFARQ